MYCKNCGQSLNENQAVCLNCGVEVGKGNGYCYNCGKEVNPNAAFCLGCGVAINNNTVNAAANSLGGRDKMVMALVCFFLGAIGIHNFMMGETKKGVFKIIMSCLCGIGEILALIDFFKILCGTYVVNTEKLF